MNGRSLELNGQVYNLGEMSDAEIIAWARERRRTDEIMFQLRQKYHTDAELLAAIERGEIK